MRRFTMLELAIGASLLGSVAAVAIPTFIREVHASRLVEPTAGLARLSASAVAVAEVAGHFTESAALTPALPPRGVKVVDPAGTWDVPTWKVLDFRATPEGVPHAFAFGFESSGTGFVAVSHGDLDGDGLSSTFEMRGAIVNGQPQISPGMYVESELE